jgi:hypothetical protein
MKQALISELLESQALLIERNIYICELYERLCAVKESGVQKYSTDYILMRMRKRFFIQEKTILRIIKGNYKINGRDWGDYAEQKKLTF